MKRGSESSENRETTKLSRKYLYTILFFVDVVILSSKFYEFRLALTANRSLSHATCRSRNVRRIYHTSVAGTLVLNERCRNPFRKER